MLPLSTDASMMVTITLSPQLTTETRVTTTTPSEKGSGEFVEHRLSFFEVGRVEAFGEPEVDGREKVARLGGAALVAAEPGEAHGGAQFPELGLLLPSDAQGFAIHLLSRLSLS